MKLFRSILAASILLCSSPAIAQQAPVYRDRDGNYQSSQGVTAIGSLSIATAQVSVGVTATLIAPARVGRSRIGVTVVPAVQCAFGPATVTLANGWPLAAVAYASDSWDTEAALYGVCASAATTVAYRETF